MSVAKLYAVPTTSGLRWKWVYAAPDAAETDAVTAASGNVLANDLGTSVSQVAGSAANVGVAVAGSNGGLFTIGSDGAWMFDPNSEFAFLVGEETATTDVAYHVFDGATEVAASVVVTVSSPNIPVAITHIGTTLGSRKTAPSPNTYTFDLPVDLVSGDLVIVCSAVSQFVDKNMSIYTPGYIGIADLYIEDSVSANLGISYKIMGDIPDVSVEVVGAGSPNSFGCAAVAIAFRGVDPANPIDAQATSTGRNTGIAKPPGISPITPLSTIMVVAHVALASSSNSTIIAPNPLDDFETFARAEADGCYCPCTVGVATKQWDGGTITPAEWSGLTKTSLAWAAATIALRPA